MTFRNPHTSYAMLVPFLMFALGVSHGIQMFNAMAHQKSDGMDMLTAARRACRSVYVPGLAALFTDCMGFISLFVIMIGVIQDIAVGANIGVAVVAFTDLIFLPVLMSYSVICDRTIMRFRTPGENRSSINPLIWIYNMAGHLIQVMTPSGTGQTHLDF